MKIDTENPFYKLGSALIAANFTDLDLENAIYDDNHIMLQRKYASALASFLDQYEETRQAPCKMHLAKIASTKNEDWNDSCEDTLMHCTNTLQSLGYTPEKFAKVAAATELALATSTLPASVGLRAVGLGIPLVGALGGGASWILEKELTEDDSDVEYLKLQMREHKHLAHEIEKQLRNIYGYKTLEEQEAEKAEQDNLKALAEKEISED